MKQKQKHLPIKTEQLKSSHFLGIFLISSSALLLEFTLTRILSVSLWYNFAFMIISIALLGFGMSGVILSVSDFLKKSKTDNLLPALSVIYGISIIISFWVINKIPYDPFSLLTDSIQFLYMPLYYLLILLPFLFAGLIISVLITRFQGKVTKLYFFDLTGAGIACFVFVFMIPIAGGNGNILIAALIGLFAGYIFSAGRNKIFAVTSLILLVVSASLFINIDKSLPISISPNKEFFNLAKQRPDLVIFSEWNAFSKIDVMIDEDEPVDGYKLYIAVIDEGNANANIPSLKSLPPPQKPADASNLAFVNKDSCESVYIIGSSGGGEILTSLYHNAHKITAVEINGIFNNLIANKLSYWTGSLVRNNRVNLVTDDARAYLQNTESQFDVILSAHTISASALSSGAMSMVENFVLTKEAVKEYLDKLKSNGILYISRPEIQLPKLTTTLREVDGSSTDIFKKKIALFKRIGGSGTIEEQNSYLAGAIYKKDGFSEPDILNLRNEALKLGIELIYDFTGSRNEFLKSLVENPDISSVINSSAAMIAPATDDKPFFDNSFGFGKLTFKNLIEVFSQNHSALLSLKEKPVAEATLLVLLIQVSVIALMFLIIPVIIKKSSLGSIGKQTKKFGMYFAFIGIGYIVIQISLMQRFTLFLGQPVYTMLAVISTMLVSSGFGSLLTKKFFRSSKSLFFIFGVIAIITLLIGFAAPYMFYSNFHLPLAIRILVTIMIIFPLGFFMGMPFPLGILNLQGEEKSFISFCWGINGFFSVTGSVAAVILSMIFGFKFNFVFAAAMYLFAMFLLISYHNFTNRK